MPAVNGLPVTRRQSGESAGNRTLALRSALDALPVLPAHSGVLVRLGRPQPVLSYLDLIVHDGRLRPRPRR